MPLSCRRGHGIYLCRAHALDPGGVRFDGVRRGDDCVGPFHGALVLGSLFAVQVGYLGGICLRSLMEHVGIAEPIARPRHRH